MEGLTLTIIRLIQNLSQTDLAARIGIDRTTLCMLENGQRPISPHYRWKLHAAGINLDDPLIAATILQLQHVINNGHPQGN